MRNAEYNSYNSRQLSAQSPVFGLPLGINPLQVSMKLKKEPDGGLPRETVEEEQMIDEESEIQARETVQGVQREWKLLVGSKEPGASAG